ncbi:MAG: cyclic nucleotide-binding domain-containing protein [Acidobacteriota bacterium]
MTKRSFLSKGAVLWEFGDLARSIAVVEQGKLGIRTEKGDVIGVVLPKMILGETAIFTLDGQAPRRTATAFAMEDYTQVTEYPVLVVKGMVESGNLAIISQILKTLTGQVSRICLVLSGANRDRPVIRSTMQGLLTGIVHSAKELGTITTWDDFFRAFRFLSIFRDELGRLCGDFMPGAAVQSETLDKLSTTIKEMFGGDDSIVLQLEQFVDASREKET